MPDSQNHIRLRWIYAAFLLSLLAILGHSLIPQRRLNIIPGEGTTTLYADGDSTGTTQAEWIDRENYTFRCTYLDTPADYKFCGLNITQGDGFIHGVDFSRYKTITLKIDYKGNAPILRVYLRHFSDDYSNTQDSRNSAKYNRILIPVEHLESELQLNIRQFTVADWWIARYGATQELLQPEYSNIVNLGIDTPTGTPAGVHEFHIYQMEARGDWISREHWYLTIVAFWFMALVMVSLQKYLRLRHQINDSNQRLSEAISKAQQLEEESAKYRELSLIDQLTKTLNRRGVMQTIDRYDQLDCWFSTAVILLDVDHFKQINDNYGHDTGDQVLTQIGRILRDNVRTQDYVGRWGGEEFILICPQTSARGAEAIAEKIRSIIETYLFSPNHSFGVSVSLGIGVARQGETFEDVYHRADNALYEAKHNGRNCVIVASTDL